MRLGFTLFLFCIVINVQFLLSNSETKYCIERCLKEVVKQNYVLRLIDTNSVDIRLIVGLKFCIEWEVSMNQKINYANLVYINHV